MPTFNEVIFNVKNLYEGGLGSDDDNVSNDQIIFDINYYRAKLIREDLMKGRSISPYLIQEIACLDMETVDKAECCDITTDCYILRSKKKLPKTIEVYDKILIIAILSADREISFPLSSEAQLRWSKYNKYTKKSVKAFIRNNYLYLINNDVIEYVTVQGIFEKPEELMKFKTCEGKPCFSFEDEYPVSSHMLPIITQLISEKEMRYMNTIPPDITNNAMSDNNK